MIRRKLFGSDYVDEIKLAEIASAINIDEKENIKSIQQKHGIDVATYVLYKKLISKNIQFINQINSYPAKKITATIPTKIIIIPGMFYKEHPEVGADGRFIQEIASNCGFEAEVLNTDSCGAVSTNSKIIELYLNEAKHPNIWLISLSKGTSEVRKYLQEKNKNNIQKNIKGWISISGIIGGTPLAEIKLSNSAVKLFYRIFCKIAGVEYKVIKELTRDYWNEPFIVPDNFQMVHIAGVPILPHIQPYLIKKYRTLSSYGPNDGIILLEDMLDVAGKVYPLWGMDHFLRSHIRSELIYRLCYYTQTIN